jgi:rubrerythrin
MHSDPRGSAYPQGEPSVKGDERENLHALPPEIFREQVHSFEFWFGAVQGYLEGREYGHRPGATDAPLAASERERLIGALCHYCVGETAALEGAGGLVRLAPSREAKIFLATQTVDEARHLEVLSHRLRELGIDDVEAEVARRASPKLEDFRRRLLGYIHGGDFAAALYAQNVILEAMEFAVFHHHAAVADPVTREVLLGIVADERRHLGFGENELGRLLHADRAAAARLREVRREMDDLVLESLSDAMAGLGLPASERTEVGRHYLESVARLGFA